MSLNQTKHAVITGATSGIGLETARALVNAGYFVFILGRNTQRLQELEQEFSPERVKGIFVDLANLKTVEQAANEIQHLTSYIDVLILNAGGIFETFQETHDGLEWSFQVNHLSHFLLTQRLLPLLLGRENPRIISVSSEAHRLGKYRPQDLEGRQHYNTWRQYGDTKLMNILFTLGLHQRYNKQGISAFALHPGVVRSGFGANNRGWLKYFSWMPFLKTPAQGAATSIFLALDPAIYVLSGRYFKDKRAVEPSDEAKSIDAADALWEKSREILQQKGFLGS